MQLLDIREATGDDLRHLVRKVLPVKIYYVWMGRNAWWTTWSTTYSPGCFHTTLASAKSTCEWRRKQGTVFYIDEIPALAFIAEKRAVIVVEINTRSFFEGIDIDRLRSTTELLPVETMTLKQISLLMGNRSALWPKDYSWRDRVHLAFANDEPSLMPIAPDSPFTSTKSFAMGTLYSLGWHSRPFGSEHKTVHLVSDAFGKKVQ